MEFTFLHMPLLLILQMCFSGCFLSSPWTQTFVWSLDWFSLVQSQKTSSLILSFFLWSALNLIFGIFRHFQISFPSTLGHRCLWAQIAWAHFSSWTKPCLPCCLAFSILQFQELLSILVFLFSHHQVHPLYCPIFNYSSLYFPWSLMLNSEALFIQFYFQFMSLFWILVAE